MARKRYKPEEIVGLPRVRRIRPPPPLPARLFPDDAAAERFEAERWPRGRIARTAAR